MGYCLSVFFVSLIVAVVYYANAAAAVVPFQQNFKVIYGSDHIQYFNNGAQVQLSLDNWTGSGFGSKVSYSYGLFQMKIKLPKNNTTGIITTFYLSSATSNHDEVDFEFLGGNTLYTLHTNIFTNGQGGREQQFQFWFNPTADFHTYKILWNEHQIVLFVDEIPIRVFKNNTKFGISYPTQPMQLLGTIWQGDWATNGSPVNWSSAPFQAEYQGFGIDGCQAQSPEAAECRAANLTWNGESFWELSPTQRKAYEEVRKAYLKYDYCFDAARYPDTPPECQHNQII